MPIPAISSDNLIKALDDSINELDSSNTASLFRLAIIFKAIADCNKDQTYVSAFEISIGIFANALQKAEEITRIPLLEAEVRAKHKQKITNSIREVKSALNIIKIQCNQNVNYEELFKAVGIFIREYGILNEQIAPFQKQLG